MEKLTEMAIKVAIAEKKQPLTTSQISLIHRRLHEAFPLGIRTPNHPTYASMIYKAIAELNEGGGSSEASISEYIKGSFEDLPWAHRSYLNHHLNKLCDAGLLVFSATERCYSTPLFNDVQELNSGNQTTTRQRSAFLQENEFTEVEVCGIGDENLTSLCEIQVLRENPGQEEQEHSNAVITNLSNPQLTDLTRKKSGSAGVKRKKKQAIKAANKVVVCSLPSRLTHPRQCTTRKKKNSQVEPKELIPLPLDCTSSKFHEHKDQQELIQCEESKWPSCVQSLLEARFFEECEVHANTNKQSVCNFYCLDCTSGALCASCLTDSHEDHSVIKIRRTRHEDAVDVARIQMHIDISGIHTRKVNGTGSTYVSLKRTVGSTSRGTIYRTCACCDRHIPDPFCFCSVSCKDKDQHQTVKDVGALTVVD